MHAALARSRSGYLLASGNAHSVGVSGLTLGGGVGFAARMFGLAADSVLQATVVLANGSIVQASATSEPDLFWVSLVCWPPGPRTMLAGV